ncbi:major type 1 subunit fimbrin (pilin) [Luteibacter sp. Sphag1AF]|uniref:fimbrial protein n=1 Tax=Luteibacter sp. Sphag1AF TaxID=2587031 RepID=UPI00162132E9|nr:fimbrial protein [Luteibacter sp. Sphag1AF]MBB3226976.1 major type 1 subunit fimbrin (pilin) [Luteibacter sp. Sphag1AF]
MTSLSTPARNCFLMQIAFPSLAASLLAVFSHKALAENTTTVTIKGIVEGGTCDISVGDRDRTVELATLPSSHFNSNVSGGDKDFFITVDNCDDDALIARFAFSGSAADPPFHEVFRNLGDAKGVGVRIYFKGDGSDSVIYPGRHIDWWVTNHQSRLHVAAQYYKVGNNVVAGSVIAPIQLDMSYL